MNFDEVRQIALSFPEVEEHVLHGGPVFRVGKRFLTCIAKIDADSLVVKLPHKLEREYLLSTRPDIYHTTPHYENWDSLLVRMSKVDHEELRQLLEQAWLEYAPKRLVKTYTAHKTNG